MTTDLFGTDGIRGPVGRYPIDAKGAEKIGLAVATHFAQPGKLVVVGRDPRESSPWLLEAVIKGLVSAGARVENSGVLPTPGLAYLIKQRQAVAGVMITASHNPFTDNGIKIFSAGGRKLTDQAQAELNKLAESSIEERAGGSSNEAPTAVNDYQDNIVAVARGVSFANLRLAVDSANGAASGLARRVFEQLGARVVSLSDQPDGKNINDGCGATDTTKLQETVKSDGLDAGVAFDGDADRVVMVDGRGRQLTGDHILYILAITGGHKTVVATRMSNTGLETALAKHGIVLKRTDVGDRYVLAALEETGASLGGEQSGHIILTEHSSTGDGLLTAVATLSQVISSSKSLADWYDEVPLVPQKLVNIPLADKDLLDRPEITAFVASATRQLEGIGQLSIRASGTEPKLRIMVEAPDAEKRAEAIAEALTKLLIAAGK